MTSLFVEFAFASDDHEKTRLDLAQEIGLLADEMAEDSTGVAGWTWAIQCGFHSRRHDRGHLGFIGGLSQKRNRLASTIALDFWALMVLPPTP